MKYPATHHFVLFLSSIIFPKDCTWPILIARNIERRGYANPYSMHGAAILPCVGQSKLRDYYLFVHHFPLSHLVNSKSIEWSDPQ